MKKIIILFICLTSSIWHVCAQTKVSGIVKDAQGMEMIGATVLQKGTNNGIVTGLDGKFTLTLSNKAEQTLLISNDRLYRTIYCHKKESSFYQYHFGRRHCTIR